MQEKSFEILKVLLTRPFARLFWRLSVRKAILIAKHHEAQFK